MRCLARTLLPVALVALCLPAARDTQRVVARDSRAEASKASTARRTQDTTSTTQTAKSIFESRGKTVIEGRRDKVNANDRYNRVMASVGESAVPESRPYVLPKDWVEKSKKRSAGVKMTAAEKAIMKALESTVDADFSKASFEDVIDHLRKKMKVTITVDKRALTEVGASYETEVNLKLKASTRTVLKRILADLNLMYVIKDEAIQITSRERAKEMTTTRTYYIGDLAAVVDVRLDDITKQLMMIQTVNNIITTITNQVDKQSWKVNNPDAVGAIVFDPITMSLIVKQTAEVHFLLGSK
jgi:hypothetical protein